MPRRKRSILLPSRPLGPTVGLVLALSALLGWLVLPAMADEEIVIQPETVISGPPGSVHEVSTVPVPVDMVGKACDLRVVTKNGSSVHVGNSLVVATGSDRIVVEGVEDSASEALLATRRVKLGAEIVVEIKLGAEGWSSLGFTLGFECSPESLEPIVDPGDQVNQSTTTLPSTTVPAVETTPPPTPPMTPPPPPPPPPTAALSAPVPTVLPSKVQVPVLPRAAPARATTANPNFTG